MPKQTARSKFFTVGKTKPSPARAASTRRASIRRSIIHSPQAELGLGLDALDTMPEDDALVTPTRRPSLQSPPNTEHTHMKDSPLPALPSGAVSRTGASSTLPHTLQHFATASRMPQGRSQRVPQNSANQQPQSIFRRLTSRFRSTNTPSQPPPLPSQTQVRPRPSRDGTAPPDASRRKSTILRVPKAPAPAPPPNDFTSLEQRQAALRARGLLPAEPNRFRDADGFMMSLSEQEAEIDRRFTVMIPGDESGEESESEATRIRQAWLSKQEDASPSSRERESVESKGRSEVSNQPEAPPVPRKSDALERASRDGTIGERSPRRATFVDAPLLSPNVNEFGARVASPDSITVQDSDFHSARDGKLSPPSSPSRRRPPVSTSNKKQSNIPSSPSAHSEKVFSWLRTSVDPPTSLSEFPAPPTKTTEPSLSVSPRTSLASDRQVPQSPTHGGSGTVRARKEKPPPIIVTQDGKSAAAQAQVIADAIAAATAAPSDSEASSASDHGRPSLSGTRGRPARLMHSQNTNSRTVPALSPTRTVSSSADSALPTPTTISHAHTSLVRDASISRGSMSTSSDNGHDTWSGIGRPRRGTGLGLLNTIEGQGKVSGTAPVIMEECNETEQGGEVGGLDVTAPAAPPTAAVARPRFSQEGVAVPRPPRVQTAEQTAEKTENRKSFSLFTKKSLEIPRDTRTSSSMMNLRRAFTSSTKPRPKSTLDPAAAADSMGARRRPKMPDASKAPGAYRPPPRQAVAPTMHSHGTIVHQTHFIEDDESRRLSEMAFLT